MTGEHVPVLLEECIRGLCIKPDGIYVDGTLGRGGHSERIARELKTGRLICIDRDEAAIEASRQRLEPYSDVVTVIRANFRDLGMILDGQGIDQVD